jgi:acyl-CoA synthetase (AMP-forming)/AMP-acid ligase II/acyl carrier protein/NRPS condensation-like uncharacterized protein
VSRSHILNLIESQTSRSPEDYALLPTDSPALTYAGLRTRIVRAALALNALGVKADDCIALVLPNGSEMATTFLAVASCAACAPLNHAYTKEEFAFFFSDLKPAALIVSPPLDSPAVEVAKTQQIPVLNLNEIYADTFTSQTPAFSAPDKVALLLHTSGTTARPKMVPLTHKQLLASASHIANTLQLSSSDRCLNVMPLFHIHGLIGALLSTMAAGGSVVCTPGFYAPNFYAWLDQFQPTWYTAVPTIHQAILSRAEGNQSVIAHHRLRFIRSSSAALPGNTLAELEGVFKVPVIEAYGMTEASHQIASNPLGDPPRKRGSVGVAAGPEIAVMDAEGNLLPVASRGEVVIRGPNVMSGYRNFPNANETAFTNGWFRTGDLGYLDQDGYLFLAGRLKEQINRGGEKISPLEVDEVLMTHPAVWQAVAFAVEHAQLGEDIHAAVILREGSVVSERQLRDFALKRLAYFKVPAKILFVKEIPKGPTGKLQRSLLAKTLAVKTELASPQKSSFAEPQSTTERAVTDLWAKVLGLSRISIHDNFIDLGGDSILAALLVSRIRDHLEVEIPILSFFEGTSTIAEISREIDRLKESDAPAHAMRASLFHEGPFPLSLTQRALWLLDQMQPGLPAYIVSRAIRLRGDLNAGALQYSLNEIAKRHETLRTKFDWQSETPVQIVMAHQSKTIAVVNLEGMPQEIRNNEARSIVLRESQRPFDLASGSLWRAMLIRLDETNQILLVSVHHIVCDGWSFHVLWRELATIYNAQIENRDSPLIPLTIQYRDFVEAQQRWLASPESATHLAYWKEHLKDSPKLIELPTDHPRSRVQSYRGARQTLILESSVCESLRVLSKRKGVTLFVTFLAAWKTLLHRWTNQNDIVVGTPVIDRYQTATEELIGCFINTLALRTNLHNDLTFEEVVELVRTTVNGAYAFHNAPFERVVAEVNPIRDPGHNPIFLVMFNYRNLHGQKAHWDGLKVDEFEFDRGTAAFDLTLDVTEKGDCLPFAFEYNTDLFDSATISCLIGQFKKLLENIAADPRLPIGAIPISVQHRV